MLKVVSRRTIKPENLEKVLEMYDEMITETRKEKGCISYEFFQDINEENTIAMIEEWEDQECFDAHAKSPHFERIIPQVAELQESSELRIFRKLK